MRTKISILKRKFKQKPRDIKFEDTFESLLRNGKDYGDPWCFV